jgi:hypothetical protein
LYEIIDLVGVPAELHRKGAQLWNGAQHRIVQ